MSVADRTDADIQRDVTESLYWDTRVDAARIGVLVEDGRVTLVGSVPTYRARAAAREDALVIRGVQDVVNRVEVEISAQLDTPTDEQLQETVTEVLSADPDLGAADVQAEVSEGSVHLRGSVRTYWERELARSVTATLPGVRGLVNELVVVPDGDHDDVELAQQLTATLTRNRHVDPSAVEVSVSGGHVTLTGHVRDEAVHEQVLDAARHTAGVIGIDDRLYVDVS